MGIITNYWNEFILRCNSAFQLRKSKKGTGNYVFGKIAVICPRNLTVGNKCRINHNAYINASNGITLGDDVTLSAGVSLLSTGIDYLSWADGQRSHAGGGIVIGSHVWIGANATILPGIQITGKYVVIAASAVVTHDISEDYCIVAGNPGRIIKKFTNSVNCN